MDIMLVIVFCVIFYFVFSFIWRHTKTISFNGLSGFLDSWISQIVCAAIISWFITIFVVGGFAEAGNAVSNFFRKLDLYDIVGILGFIYLVYDFFIEDLFDRGTFRKNYNSKVNELFSDVPFSVLSMHEGNIFQPNGNKDDVPLNLPEEFISTGDSKLLCFPTLSIKNVVGDNFKRMRFSFDYLKRGEISESEKEYSKVVITAMIEAVAAGKSKEIESALRLIDSHGIFNFPTVDYTLEHEVDGVNYHFSKNASGMLFSLTKQIKSAESK